jgi:hypothetical protein
VCGEVSDQPTSSASQQSYRDCRIGGDVVAEDGQDLIEDYLQEDNGERDDTDS